MKKMSWLLAMVLVVLGVGLSPARADLFGFTVSDTQLSFDGTTLTTTDNRPTSMFHLYRTDLDQAANLFGGLDGFKLEMTITDVTDTSALGAGTFTFHDSGTDTVTGFISGSWVRANDGTAKFTGSLSKVYYNNGENQNPFDGWLVTGVPPVANPSFVSMDFEADQPWYGGQTQITASGVWFGSAWEQPSLGGSIDAVVTPVPAALLIGLLGLGTAGLKLRRFA